MPTESSTSPHSADALPSLRAPRSLRRRALFRFLWVAYVGGLLLAAGWGYRVYRLASASSSVHTGHEYWRINYPELAQSGVLDADLRADDGYVDVLLLGASVLEEASRELEARLRDEFGERLRVYQLCRAAHTSRDSVLKYSRIRDKHFDLIINYDGVNDVRMNCCPEEEFRDDYTHCGWYRSMARKEAAETVSLAELLEDEVRFSIPLGEPEPELLQYGSRIKTERPFRDNLAEIIAAAREQNIPVMLMTFAYHIPENYTRDKFDKRELDYGKGRHELPAELWGTPGNLARTLDRQNLMIDELASRYDNVFIVDMRRLMPADGLHFSDPCHLTKEGNRRFVDNMMPAVSTCLKSTPEGT